MTSEQYHEPLELLSENARDLHRAIRSLMEELEAVDWYQQRVEATGDADLKAILAHNRDEEIEHAMMVLEWIRRRHPKFDLQARTYLFSDGPVTEIESAEDGGGDQEDGGSPSAPGGSSLGIGGLRS